MNRATIAFTGGGTGGHVFPGLAVAEALRAGGFAGRLAWIGSKKDSDRKVVEAAGLEFFAIPSGKLRRRPSLENAVDAFRVLAGYSSARRLLKELRPALLFSKGGYVSVPPCWAAASLGIPYITHESDLSPGLATRINSRRADMVVISYEATRARLPSAARGKTIVAGNPVRAAIRRGDAARGRALLGVRDAVPVIFFLGGSQGARQINELAVAALPRLSKAAFVLHQRGEFAPDDDTGAFPPDGPRYKSYTFIREEMPDLLAAADLVVGRAGAGTLWECAALEKAMLLVPLCGSGTRGDQVDNADFFERAGAALSLVGSDATADRLAEEALGLLGDSPRRAAMGRSAKSVAGRDAASEISVLILDRIREGL